ncbi:UbiA prenyltransferase family [Flagelloscypha sp. PMI_526]|nr:UbiA prenyltransferase family [Flagelloscypha sp. PMI_526]
MNLLSSADIIRPFRTLFLFTYTDFKTIFFPVSLFALANAPLSDFRNALPTFFWIWLHQLHINVSNQYRSLDEDKVNKPWRPLPAGLISSRNAIILRFALVPACLLYSMFSSQCTVLPSLAMALEFIAYDDAKLSRHWLSKNIMNAIGYVSFEYGATSAMCGCSRLRDEARISLLISGFIILTTIHAADFADVEGDTAQGRQTFPILYPRIAKGLVVLGVPFWTGLILQIWELHPFYSAVLLVLGFSVSALFYEARDEAQCSKAYLLYNIWLLIVHILPWMGSRAIAGSLSEWSVR